MHHRNGLGAGGDQRSNGGSCDGAGIGIHIGEHRLGAKQHSTGGSGDEGARRCDQFIIAAEADGQIGSGEGQRAIGHGNGMGSAAPLSKILLKGGGFLAGPGVHIAGGEHTAGGLDLLGVELGPGGEIHDQTKVLKHVFSTEKQVLWFARVY